MAANSFYFVMYLTPVAFRVCYQYMLRPYKHSFFFKLVDQTFGSQTRSSATLTPESRNNKKANNILIRSKKQYDTLRTLYLNIR